MNTTYRSYRAHAPLRSAAVMLGVFLNLWAVLSEADEADPAGRVARVSYLLGNIYLQTGEDRAWLPAAINEPLTSGDELRTDPGARAELQLGNAAIQIDDNTEMQLAELSDEVLRLNLEQGVVNVRVRRLDEQERVEIITPNAAIAVREPGTYRIDAEDGAETLVQVRAGGVQIDGARQQFTLHANEQMRLSDGQHIAAEFDTVPAMDEFERWAADRNQRAERAVSTRYVSSEVIGYEDLDDYGDWNWVADYGYVWAPRYLHAGWAPYRTGRWRWIDPWGWTWIDTAPWGFAPFHYGRWASIRNRWCWVPGPRNFRPVYAPALVAWIGTPGLRVSAQVGAPPVGWIPLGPREVYRPIYRSSHNYVINVNRGSGRFDRDELERGLRGQPHDIPYRNRSATTIVPADALRDRRPIDRQWIRQPGLRLQTVDRPAIDAPRGERFERPGNAVRDERGGPSPHWGANPPARDNNRERSAEPTLRQRSIVTSPWVRPETRTESRTENGMGIKPPPQEPRGNAAPSTLEPRFNRPQMHRDLPTNPQQSAPRSPPAGERSGVRPWSGNDGGGRQRSEAPRQRDGALAAPAAGGPDRGEHRGGAERGNNRERMRGDTR